MRERRLAIDDVSIRVPQAELKPDIETHRDPDGRETIVQ